MACSSGPPVPARNAPVYRPILTIPPRFVSSRRTAFADWQALSTWRLRRNRRCGPLRSLPIGWRRCHWTKPPPLSPDRPFWRRPRATSRRVGSSTHSRSVRRRPSSASSTASASAAAGRLAALLCASLPSGREGQFGVDFLDGEEEACDVLLRHVLLPGPRPASPASVGPQMGRPGGAGPGAFPPAWFSGLERFR